MARTPLASLVNYLRRLHYASAVEMSDYELLQQFAIKRDEAAFEALVRRHAGLVWSVCRRLLDNDHDAEDAFQAVFLVLLRKSASLRVGPSLANWLHSVASRIAQKSRVTRLRCRLREMRAETPKVCDPFASVESRDLRTLLDEELDRLPEKYRAPLVLCYLEGLSYTEAARQLGWRDGTICGRLARARELLRKRLSRRGLTLSGAVVVAALTEPTNAPAATVAAAARMAALFALGQAAGGTVSPAVATLAQSVLQAMTAAKLKTLALLIVVVGVFAAGAGVTASHFLAMQASNTETDREQPDRPKNEKAERTDLYGDPLPPGALLRMGTVRFRNRGFIGSVAFSPDGRILAAGGIHGIILLYDSMTGRKLLELKANSSSIPPLAFAPDGKTLASIGTQTIQIWDTTTGNELRRFRAGVADNISYDYTHPIPVVYSHNGKLLASVAANHSLRVWEVESGKELIQMKGHSSRVRCLAFSADDKTLFSADGEQHASGSARAWAVGTGKEGKKYALVGGGEERRSGTPLCFSSDGKTLAFSAHESWNSKKGRNIIHHEEHVVSFLDLETGQTHRSKLEPQQEPYLSAVFSRDGKSIATMSAVRRTGGEGTIHSLDGNRIAVWDTETGKQFFAPPAYAEHFYDIKGPNFLSFAPNCRKLAAATLANSLRVWDLDRDREQREKFAAHDNMVQCVVFSPDGRTLASAGSDSTIALWDAATGRQRFRLRGHGGTFVSLAFSPDGKYLASASTASCAIDQTVYLWDATSGKELHHYEVPMASISDSGECVSVNTWVAFTSNGKILAAGGSDRKTRLWDVATGKELRNQTMSRLRTPANATRRELFQWPKQITDVTFTQDGRTMALCAAKILSIVDVASAQPLFQFERDGFPAFLALSPDGKTLLHGAGKSIRFIEVASGTDLHQVALSEEVFSAAFSPDGRIVAVGAGEAQATIRLIDVATSKELLRLRGVDSRVRHLAFSPDGTKLASGQWDTTALIWDVSATRRNLPTKNLTTKDLERLWLDLRDADARKAHAALWTLVAAPDKAGPFLKEHLQPVPHVAAERLRHLIADLDAEDFARREEASRSLAKLGSEAEPALRKALEDKPALELRRRVQALLDGLACQTEMTPETLRQLRAIQVLEQIGTPQARQILSSLAKGAPAAPATRDAAAALARLNR